LLRFSPFRSIPLSFSAFVSVLPVCAWLASSSFCFYSIPFWLLLSFNFRQTPGILPPALSEYPSGLCPERKHLVSFVLSLFPTQSTRKAAGIAQRLLLPVYTDDPFFYSETLLETFSPPFLLHLDSAKYPRFPHLYTSPSFFGKEDDRAQDVPSHSTVPFTFAFFVFRSFLTQVTPLIACTK